MHDRPWDAERGSPQATTLSPCARLSSMPLFLEPLSNAADRIGNLTVRDTAHVVSTTGLEVPTIILPLYVSFMINESYTIRYECYLVCMQLFFLLSLCWLLATSVRKTRRFILTDVASSQHEEIRDVIYVLDLLDFVLPSLTHTVVRV